MANKHFSINNRDTEQFLAKMKTADKELVTNMTKKGNKVGYQVEADAKALAPRDTGQLEQSIRSTGVKYANGQLSLSVGSPLVYALRRHEEPARQGTHNKYARGVKYHDYYYNGRGELTRAKSNVSGFQPGRKYLTNAKLLNQSRWRNELAKAVTETYGG